MRNPNQAGAYFSFSRSQESDKASPSPAGRPVYPSGSEKGAASAGIYVLALLSPTLTVDAVR